MQLAVRELVAGNWVAELIIARHRIVIIFSDRAPPSVLLSVSSAVCVGRFASKDAVNGDSSSKSMFAVFRVVLRFVFSFHLKHEKFVLHKIQVAPIFTLLIYFDIEYLVYVVNVVCVKCQKSAHFLSV